ncbi:MAG: carbon monoxide dehydrogenase accessory protein CooC [Candidatus Dormibacteria bacterium]
MTRRRDGDRERRQPVVGIADGAGRAPAEGRAPLRVAFIGKGGSGKSVLAGTVCRLLARSGRPVLALDVDTMPGLALSLGGPDREARLPLGLAEVVETRRGKHWRVLKGAGAAHLVDTYAVAAPDGVRLLELGKLPGRVEPASTVAFRHVMQRFRRPGWAVVADLAAGTRQPVFGWADFASVRLIVVEPSAKGLMTARRLTAVGTHLIVNKVRSAAELEIVRRAIDLPVAASIPYDEGLAEAERDGRAPIDSAPGSPTVRACGELTCWLEGSS